MGFLLKRVADVVFFLGCFAASVVVWPRTRLLLVCAATAAVEE